MITGQEQSPSYLIDLDQFGIHNDGTNAAARQRFDDRLQPYWNRSGNSARRTFNPATTTKRLLPNSYIDSTSVNGYWLTRTTPLFWPKTFAKM